jgi:hypothetical protein
MQQVKLIRLPERGSGIVYFTQGLFHLMESCYQYWWKSNTVCMLIKGDVGDHVSNNFLIDAWDQISLIPYTEKLTTFATKKELHLEG